MIFSLTIFVCLHNSLILSRDIDVDSGFCVILIRESKYICIVFKYNILFIPVTAIIILLLNCSCLIVVKNPGLFLIFICFVLYKFFTTSTEVTTSASLLLARDSLILKFSITFSIISSSLVSLFKRSIIWASMLSISL